MWKTFAAVLACFVPEISNAVVRTKEKKRKEIKRKKKKKKRTAN